MQNYVGECADILRQNFQWNYKIEMLVVFPISNLKYFHIFDLTDKQYKLEIYKALCSDIYNSQFMACVNINLV